RNGGRNRVAHARPGGLHERRFLRLGPAMTARDTTRRLLPHLPAFAADCPSAGPRAPTRPTAGARTAARSPDPVRRAPARSYSDRKSTQVDEGDGVAEGLRGSRGVGGV